MTEIKTRFPPEPNGHMHLGHAKSAYNNFNYPFNDNISHSCSIRFDDTNPKTEKQEYVDSILKDLEWLGYPKVKVVFTSDYFDEILEYTQLLINKGLAYCDPSTGEEIHKQRMSKTESPYRDRSVEDNISIFYEMVVGNYKEGEMTLRLKIPIEERTNECMIDPIAYRVIEASHYRTGNKFKIYPTYEYSHYIVDSLEGITHSFCTLEFYVRRNLSYWILDKLELRKPIIEETNRLETDFGLLSKRKIKDLIEKGNIEGWDDPRLLTISGLRKRGITPQMINNFCSKQSYTKNMNAIIEQQLFDSVIRNNLADVAPRRMGVFNPLKVNLINYHQKHIFYKPLFPKCREKGQIMTNLCPTVYIEKEDFQKTANKKYKRMTIDKAVRLKYMGIIKYVSHKEDEEGNVIEIDANFIPESENGFKVNGTIHWVSYREEPEIVNIIEWKYPTKSEIKNGKVGSKIIHKVYMDQLFNEEYNCYWQLERKCYIYLEPGATTGNYLVGLKENAYVKQMEKS